MTALAKSLPSRSAPVPDTPALLDLQGLTTGYGDIEVVQQVDMSFSRGVMTAIIGSNGAGKSTVIKAAAGLLPAWSGKILAKGEDITREAGFRRLKRGIAYVPQGRIVLPEMTVRENLELGGYMLGGDHRRLRSAIERLCALFPILGERMSQLAGNMSGGEQQMLAIARALVTSPDVVILDEPSLGLSPKYVAVVFEKLTELARGGLTIVVVEQKASMVLTVADYGYVMHTGRVAFRGLARELLADDRVKRVFLGEAPEAVAHA
ncbi:ABC transporter ATP-binding protein [Aquabacter sp. L1I39]|uniref:ABC transporter ATP-binding protein n=1 Tax=Aquabacter sp. L1I39 TaxID=2820278 RepID=UPI001ADAE7CC|nr:ABC transporter ATP-binding protein [Aquabacter sp. L1I39]QTL04690.1 ABC transporter ATP-binding protein [Aquabacter sp. L1I39]